MGKIISAVLEDCVLDIKYDRKYHKVFNPNTKVIDFINSYVENGYEFYIISNFCEDNYFGIDLILKKYKIQYNNLIFACTASKTDIVLNKIKPEIYIDTHIEFCSALQLFGIDTYIYLSEEACFKNNKCANGLKKL